MVSVGGSVTWGFGGDVAPATVPVGVAVGVAVGGGGAVAVGVAVGTTVVGLAAAMTVALPMPGRTRCSSGVAFWHVRTTFRRAHGTRALIPASRLASAKWCVGAPRV